MKIRLAIHRLLPTDKQTDMVKLIAAFSPFHTFCFLLLIDCNPPSKGTLDRAVAAVQTFSALVCFS
jgi:hypothetical protein